ncbi:MAG: HAD family hydrolase [Epsilonproteobacteria bacterium]|nr:MAG: HAD family hydrolase [Campylobacterota bacterium]
MIILFDLDGTLIDSTEAILESFAVAFQTHGREVPNDRAIKAEIGHPLDVMFPTLGIPQEEVQAHILAYKEQYRKIYCQKTFLLPRAREAVVLASKYAKLGVVTTKTAKYSRELLEHMGLMNYFDVLIGREDVEYPKPHPEPIFKALSKLDSDKSKYWMIGDTPMDILAANAAKINSVAVTCGYADIESLKKYTNNLCDTAFEAVQYITLS